MKIIIHNFYGRKAPSGEDNFVRRQEKDYSVYVFSELLYLKKFNQIITYIKVRLETTKRIQRLSKMVSDQDEVEVHNVTPFVDTKAILNLSKKTKVNLYAHNFRLVAPCAVLMDAKGRPCNLCTRNKYAIVLTPIWKCYRKSRLHTSILAFHILRQRFCRHFRYINSVYTFSDYHQRALRTLFGERVKFNILKNIDASQIEQYKPNQRHLSAVYLGRLTEEKGILNLIEHWKKYDMGDLHIYGDGELKSKVVTAITGHHNLHYHGFLNIDDKSMELTKYSTMIIPSICSEGYPSVISDALNYNMNLISTNIEPQASHVKALGGDVYEYDSAESLCKIIMKLKG